jgi:hypothetical protein
MGWREDVKFGITRIGQLFLGSDNGNLGTEVDVDKIIDLANNQVSTASEVDAVVQAGGGGPFAIKGFLPGSENGIGLLLIHGLALPGSYSATPAAEDCNWIAQVTAADLIRAVYCDPLKVDNLEYYVTTAGGGYPGPPGAPGWESDPEDAILVREGLVDVTEVVEVWINDGTSFMFSQTYILNQDNGVEGGEVGVDDAGCNVP